MVTIKEIALRCGVSASTVSKALNDYPDIGEEKKAYIRKIAKEMHYRPALEANGKKNSCCIGIVCTGGEDGFRNRQIKGIMDQAEKRGYDLIFISQNSFFGTYLEHSRFRRCDGIIIIADNGCQDMPREVMELMHCEIPTVCTEYELPICRSVVTENTSGAYLLTKYLIGMGHRRIAFIHGRRSQVTDKRLAGFRTALAESGMRADDEYVTEAFYNDPNTSALLTGRLMSMREPPTAVMYPDDISCIGGIRALEKDHLHVPEDISVTGFDGSEMAKMVSPQLTTFDRNAYEAGKKALSALLELIENSERRALLPVEVTGKLIKGQTVRQI